MLRKLSDNIYSCLDSAFLLLKSRIHFRNFLIVTGFCFLVSFQVMGQPGCANPVPEITFYENHNDNNSSHTGFYNLD